MWQMTSAHIAVLLKLGFVVSGMFWFFEAVGSENRVKRLTCGWVCVLHVVAALIVTFG